MRQFWEIITLSFVPPLLVMVVRLIGMTLRYELINAQALRKAKEGGNCIVVFWHQKFFPLLYSHRNSGFNILVSQHRDGELIARTLRYLGFHVTRGSTTRGGAKACRIMTRAVQEHDLAITPDGPKGPRYRFSPGAVVIAKYSGRPILPVGIGARFAAYCSSWDRFMVPFPMSNIRIVFGKVHYIEDNADDSTASRNLAKELNELNSIAERF
jgi:lysophospholipid acyltransferase (LPLAT)-like uncharacterized protein